MRYEAEFYEKYEDLDIGGFNVTDLRVIISMTLFIFSASVLSIFLLYPHMVYQRAEKHFENAEYDESIKDYESILFYRDSPDRITDNIYHKAISFLKNGDPVLAEELFLKLSGQGYKNSRALLRESRYKIASELFGKGEYKEASGRFFALMDYRDSHERYIESVFYQMLSEAASGDTAEALNKLHILKEAGRFRYDPLENPDFEGALEIVRTTSVNLYADFDSPASEWENYTGSACIYSIEPDFIYFLSAKHVLTEFGSESIDITFYDGTVVSAFLESAFLKDENSDLAMFRIKTETVPMELLLSLRETYLTDDDYTGLNEGDECFLYAANWYKKEDLITGTEFLGFDAKALTDGYYGSDYLVFSRSSREGQSGCPVFDLRGRCLAISSGYYYKKNWDEIIYSVDCHSRFSEERINEMLDAFNGCC
ncbi:MAG: hypothetical protein K5770_04190 [Lachnospiraceae bacterium]|nr:hypothetical protein [Lachnospiraceae bacterium]